MTGPKTPGDRPKTPKPFEGWAYKLALMPSIVLTVTDVRLLGW